MMASRDHDEELLMRAATPRGAPAGASLMPRRRAEQDLVAAQQQARRDADARLRHVLDAISDGYVEVDADWRIRQINRRAEELLRPSGAEHRALPGKNLWQAFPELLDDAVSIALLQAMERRESRDTEWHLAPLQRWLEVRTRASADGLALYLRDATAARAAAPCPAGLEAELRGDVRRAQDALRDETAVLELINDTGIALASTRELRSLLQEVTDAATRISGAHFGAFFYNSTGSDGTALQLYTLAGAAQGQFNDSERPRATPLPGAGQDGVGPLRIDDVLADPRYGQWPPHHGMPPGQPPLRSYLAVPVVARSGAVLGSLLFGHPEVAVFTARTERIITGIAAQAAVAIDNTRLYEAAQQAAEERKVLLDSERSARAEAERNSQMKDEFLATLSHELRTPLSAILGWSQVLRRGTRDEADLHRGLQTIERNARAQAQLIEDLLDMGRITSGQVQLHMQTLTPASAIESAIEAARPGAAAKNIRIDTVIEAGAGLISGDPNRLQQVFFNLLSNALKFTPRDGAVTVTVRQPAGLAVAEIIVSDTGIGIRADFLPHVFERFRQADASTTRRHGGLGLGLSIVKHLVEQHGGAVHARSGGEGLGAAFCVQLPLTAPSQPWPAPAPASAPQTADSAAERRAQAAAVHAAPGALAVHDLSGLKVLLVDDQADARDLAKRILQDCHAEVLTAASASEALQLLPGTRPDLLISDIGMPDTDGYQLLQQVRALDPQQGGAVPAIALTAFARAEDRDRVLAAGFRAHVAKPVDASQLIAVVAAQTGPGAV